MLSIFIPLSLCIVRLILKEISTCAPQILTTSPASLRTATGSGQQWMQCRKWNSVSIFEGTTCFLYWQKACQYSCFLTSRILSEMQRFAFFSILWYMKMRCMQACSVTLRDDMLQPSNATGQELKGSRKLSLVQNTQLCVFQREHFNFHPCLRNLPSSSSYWCISTNPL